AFVWLRTACTENLRNGVNSCVSRPRPDPPRSRSVPAVDMLFFWRVVLRNAGYWFSLPTCDRRESDLIRIEPLSNSYHMLCFWDWSTTIGRFVPSKLIFAGRERRPISGE